MRPPTSGLQHSSKSSKVHCLEQQLVVAKEGMAWCRPTVALPVHVVVVPTRNWTPCLVPMTILPFVILHEPHHCMDSLILPC